MDSKSNFSDPFGAAIQAYQIAPDKEMVINVFQEDYEEDVIPVYYLFRSYEEMPLIEQTALKYCKGKVLDIGAAAGIHAQYLASKNIATTPLDVSPLCVDYLKQIGFKSAVCKSIFDYHTEDKYDTLLLLMNGIGIAGSVSGLEELLQHFKSLMKEDGIILLDSSDLKYIYEEEDGSFLIPISGDYYGETKYQLKFQEHISNWFPWLFIDFDTLSFYAEKAGFKASLLQEGDHYDYLAKLELA